MAYTHAELISWLSVYLEKHVEHFTVLSSEVGKNEVGSKNNRQLFLFSSVFKGLDPTGLLMFS